MNYFAKLDSYEAYLEKNPFHKLLNIDLEQYGEVQKKIEKSAYHSVDPNWKKHLLQSLMIWSDYII